MNKIPRGYSSQSDASKIYGMSTDTRRKISRALDTLLKPTYFNSIPLDDIFDMLERNGVVPLDEDNTRWSGMLLGAEGRVVFPLGPVDTFDPEKQTYSRFDNTSLPLSWYKMKTGRYEVTGYLA